MPENDVRADVYVGHLLSLMCDCFRDAQKVLYGLGVRLCDYPGDLESGRLQVYEGIEILANLWGEKVTESKIGNYPCRNMEHAGIRYFQLDDEEGETE